MKIKYAVYKGSVGLYAKEYFDKIVECWAGRE